MQHLSPHFDFAELIRSDYAIRHAIDNTPNEPFVFENLLVLANGLERVRSVLALPVLVSSGYRCPIVNVAIGGAHQSQHLSGQAADIVIAGKTALQICHSLLDHEDFIGFDQLIMEGDWTHVSFAPHPRGEVLTAHFGGGWPTYTIGLQA